MLQEIQIADINRDGTQTRENLHEETVREYCERMQEGDQFPPVVVFQKDGQYWLADGFHRVESRQRAGFDTIECEMESGGKRDAILFGLTANCKHGLRRTNADKRRAVMILLEDAEWSKKSDRWIAQKAGVSPQTVGNARNATVQIGQLSDEPQTRIGRDGKERQLPKPKSQPEPQETAAPTVAEEWDGDPEDYEEEYEPHAEPLEPEIVPKPEENVPQTVLDNRRGREQNWYAKQMAECAIKNLEMIPEHHPLRREAFEQVGDFVASQLKGM